MKEFIVEASGDIADPESYGNSRETFIDVENAKFDLVNFYQKLRQVNMKLAQLGMSMENSGLKHTQQYRDLISIVEYIGMDFTG